MIKLRNLYKRLANSFAWMPVLAFRLKNSSIAIETTAVPVEAFRTLLARSSFSVVKQFHILFPRWNRRSSIKHRENATVWWRVSKHLCKVLAFWKRVSTTPELCTLTRQKKVSGMLAVYLFSSWVLWMPLSCLAVNYPEVPSCCQSWPRKWRLRKGGRTEC